jgi:hypothetical protein
VALLYGSDPAYFTNALVAMRSLRDVGTKQDIVLMQLGPITTNELSVFEGEGVRVVSIAELGGNLPLNYEGFTDLELRIYRAKLRVFQLIEYTSVIFFDVDLFFKRNLDSFFASPYVFVGRKGGKSPLNAGFFAVKQSLQFFNDLYDIATSQNYTPEKGWMEHGPIKRWHDPSKTTDWTFYGSTVDQGLIYFYFNCHLSSESSLFLDVKVKGDYIHFVGQHKITNFQTFDSITDKYKEPSVSYLRILAELSKTYPSGMRFATDFVFRMTGTSTTRDRKCYCCLEPCKRHLTYSCSLFRHPMRTGALDMLCDRLAS